MLIILTTAVVFGLSGCSTPLIPLTPGSVTPQDNSHRTPALAQNQQVLCRTNSHLYPCIITSPKTPLTPASRAPVAPSGGTSMPPLMAHHDPLETEAHLAEHENITIRLQEITSTLGHLLANLSEPESRHPLPDQTKAPSDLTSKHVFDRGGQGRDLQDLPSQNSTQDLDRSVPKRKLRVKLLASVYFSSNSTELLPSEKIVLIDLLPLVRDKQLLFVGYSDRAGDDNANARLSYKRARVVKAFFAQTGHDPGKLFAGGRGACCYKTEGNTPTGQRQNRRVEIYHTLERLRLQSPPFIKE